MSLQDAVNKVSYVNDDITKTVSEVKQRHRMKETTATNGPEGTVSKKTQVSLKLLEQRMRRLHDSITTVNKDFLDDVELCTLLTTVVENLHAVSHFKHETFNVLQYSQDFGTITKESSKRMTKWGAQPRSQGLSSYRPMTRTYDERPWERGCGGPSILPTISRTTPSRRPVRSLPISTSCNGCSQEKSVPTLKLL